MGFWRRIALPLLVVALAIRLAVLVVMFATGTGDVRGHHLESAGAIFVVAAMAARAARPLRGAPAASASVGRADVPRWWWPAFSIAAVALYWSSLSIGWLSDDFGLVARAAAWDLSPVSPIFFRPIPLAIWGGLLHLGAGPGVLHLLNVLLHGTAAYLTARLVADWAPARSWAALAGLLMLSAPLSPEVVAWCSGVFDVLAAALMLACVLTAQAYDARTSASTRVQFLVLGVAALFSKESAAIVVVLVAADVWRRRNLPRALAIDLSVLSATVLTFGVIRWIGSPHVNEAPLSLYLIEGVVSGTVGGLVAPFSATVFQQFPWLPIGSSLAAIILALRFALASGPARDRKPIVTGLVWMFAPVAVVLPIFVIAPDLQGARYLYLPMVGWATVVVALASARRAAFGRLARGLAWSLVALDIAGTLLHLGPWRAAADIRDEVLRAAAQDQRIRACADVALVDLPDSTQGAYIFRNSVNEAFARIGIVANPQASAPGCTFRWSDKSRRFYPG
jgi:hypothetical protein